MMVFHLLIRAEVAQLVEHLTENQGVTSSILVLGIGRLGTLRGAILVWANRRMALPKCVAPTLSQ